MRQASFVLRVALVAAAMYGSVAQYCPAGAVQTACDKVLVVYTFYASEAADVQSSLLGTGAFATVDTFDASHSTPSLALLEAYDATFQFSGDVVLNNPVLMGDRLAAYHTTRGARLRSTRRGAAVRGRSPRCSRRFPRPSRAVPR